MLAALLVWALGLFWIPSRVWLRPFTGEGSHAVRPANEFAGESEAWLVPARRGDRAGRRRLENLTLEPGSAAVLRLHVGEEPSSR